MEYTFTNSDDHVFKVHKVSSADNRNLMGAKFEVKGIDNDFINTYTTDALGEFTIQGRDLPTGSFEVYEIAAPEGYATDGADIQTFSWDNTRDVTLTFKNAPLPGIQIYKYDKDSKEPLAGATFEIRRDGQVLQTVKTDVNGYARVYNLPKGMFPLRRWTVTASRPCMPLMAMHQPVQQSRQSKCRRSLPWVVLCCR